MKIDEIITIIDGDNEKIMSFPKTVQGISNIMVPYLIVINKLLLKDQKNNFVDLEKAVYHTVLFRKLFESVNFEKLKTDLTVFKLYENINRYYTFFSNEYPAIVKLESFIISDYTFITNYNFYELDKIEDFDVKIYECKKALPGEEYEVLFSYPFTAEILPILYQDMQTEHDIEDCIILNNYALSYINELIKAKKIEKNNVFINFIIEEYLRSEEFFENNIENYEKNRNELLKGINMGIISQPSVYNNANILIDYLFNIFLTHKNLEFFKYLNNLLINSIDNVKEENINYHRIIESLQSTLFISGHKDEVKCIDNIIKLTSDKEFVATLYVKLYKIYNTEEFKKVFDDRDDNSRGRN